MMKSFYFSSRIIILMIMHKSKLEYIFHHNIKTYYIRIGRVAIIFGKPSHSDFDTMLLATTRTEEKTNGI